VVLSVVAISAILGSIALTAYATDDAQENSTLIEPMGLGFRESMGHGFLGGRMRGGWGCGGYIEVSAAYNETVLNIANSDTDVQNLLADGYSISAIRPIIKATVDADGSVVQKATSAVVLLTKDTTSRATAWVDLSAEKVTKIVIMTMKVIDKSS